MKKAVLIALAILVLSCSIVSAHRMYASYRVGEIEIKSWFGGGTPVRDGDVKVYAIKDGKEELYKEGKTNEKGEFSFFPRVGTNEYRIVVEATHMPGHMAEVMVNLTGVQEIGEERMPAYVRTFAGLGYLIGLAGAAMLYMGWKLKREHDRISRNR